MNPIQKPGTSLATNVSNQPPVYFYNMMHNPNMTMQMMNQQGLVGSQRGVLQPMMFYSPQVLKLPLSQQLTSGFISKKVFECYISDSKNISSEKMSKFNHQKPKNPETCDALDSGPSTEFH